MSIAKCANNHFYDDVKYEKCPHCLKAEFGGAVPSGNNSAGKKTEAIFIHSGQASTLGAQGTGGNDSSGADSQKTIGVFTGKLNMDPIAGWIVGIEGENRGRSFEVHTNSNTVGRSMNNDIKINDMHISRDKHFYIIFDPMSCEFFLKAGNGLTYHNDKCVDDVIELNDGDSITAGKSKYVFVAYCKEGRNWNED